MSTHVPMELVLIEFPRNEFNGKIVAELSRLVDAGTIEVVDALLVRKDADGSTHWFEADEADDGELTRLVPEPSGLLAAEDVDAVTDDLAPNSSVGMLLYEHTWAKGLTAALADTGGRVIDSIRIPADAIDELTSVLEKEN